jgi:sulfite exporter TauE/SafE
VHLHAHAHRGEYAVHDPARHDHAHGPRLSLRPLLVGMTHGLAGSAALVVLAAGSATTPLRGLAYVVLFGLGSIVGMAALSVAIALPLKRLARVATRARNVAHGLVGATTVALGVSIVVETASHLAG